MTQHGNYGFQIVVDGRVLPEIEKHGRTYLAAPSDRDFSIRVSTPGHERTEVVISVDGLSVMTGQDASSSERGYVITGSEEIPGFRLNDSEVASFRFGDRRDSYAARLGKPTNIGVIAVRFFSEYRPPMWRTGGLHVESGGMRRSAAASMGGATRGGGHDMGTEFGDRREHHVSETSFLRHQEVAALKLEYASTESLRKRGILPDVSPLGEVSAFPGDDDGMITGCQPPSGWKGRNKPAPPKRKLPGRPSHRGGATRTVKKSAAKTAAKTSTRRRR